MTADHPFATAGEMVPTDGSSSAHIRFALFPLLLALVFLLPMAASAQSGTLRGEVTIVGPTQLRDGEVVITRAGGNETVALGNFSWESPEYSLVLPAGDYLAYASAPVFHATDRVQVTVAAGATTWLNFTIVRVEEVIGHVNSTEGGPVAGAVVQFRLGGSVRATATTDDGGAFRTTIDPGDYDVTIVKAGFKEAGTAAKVSPGQVLRLDLSVEPVPAGDDGDVGFPIFYAIIVLFVMFVLFGSFYYVGLQSRRLRAAAAEAEARRRAAGSMCPECGADLPPRATRCARCGLVLQVRCSDCGRLVDLKDAADRGECPECGAMLK